MKITEKTVKYFECGEYIVAVEEVEHKDGVQYDLWLKRGGNCCKVEYMFGITPAYNPGEQKEIAEKGIDAYLAEMIEANIDEYIESYEFNLDWDEEHFDERMNDWNNR